MHPYRETAELLREMARVERRLGLHEAARLHRAEAESLVGLARSDARTRDANVTLRVRTAR